MAERRFGILIANSRFPEAPKLEPLRYPENDVAAFQAVLAANDRGAFHELVVLKNRPRSEILLKLNAIFSGADKDDLILIYYSGHGKLNSVGRLHLTTANTQLGALEATAISMGAIRELVDISATHKVVIILDCCFSGAVGDEFLRSSVDDQLLLASKARGTYIMTASTGIQVAKEKEVDRLGLFTKHLVEGIRSGDADLDRNGHISMDELEAQWRDIIETKQRELAERPREPERPASEPEAPIARMVKLFVATEPKGAAIKIMNIKPPFEQGMALERGRYHLWVGAEGYVEKDLWVELAAGPEKRVEIVLDRITEELPKKITNSLGMHGNVREWCGDWYTESPKGGNDPTGPPSGSLRVFRGGAFNSSARYCRAASRYWYEPGLRINILGFRLALLPGQPR